MDMLLMASLIWLGEQVAPVDSYYRFRKTFQLKSTNKTELRISADSDYAVYINGKRISVTQFPDFPDRKTFATIDISDEVKKGDNSIAVLVHHIGQSFFTHYKCDPGLMAVVSQGGKPVIVTDGTWKCSVDPCFTQNRRIIVSPQLGFTFEYDARKEEKWLETDFDDSGWTAATVHARPTANGHWASLEKRPIAQLKDKEPRDVTLVWQGWTMKTGGVPFFGSRFVQEAFDVPESERAGVNRKKPMFRLGGPVWRFKKPPQADMGVACTVDFGYESTGYITFDIEAAEGTVLEIHHGEHLDDGHPRSVIGPRNFIDRYICHDGRNTFMYPLRRIGGRYMQLIFTDFGEKLPAVYYAGISGVYYPHGVKAYMDTADQMLQGIRDMAINTLDCCMHDHYEDCPWREQSLYAYDSRNQMLYGYYVWGNYDFAKASLELLGRSYLGNGYLEICAPAESSITIPSFTMVWISSLLEHYMYSGSLDEYQRQRETVKKILEAALARKSHVEGLYEPGNEKRIWNFYEWTGRLDRCPAFPDSLYNIYLYEALSAASKLAKADGDMEAAGRYGAAAQKLGGTIEQSYWDEKSGCYAYLLPSEHPKQEHYEHVQALMLFNDLVPQKKVESVVEAIRERKLTACTYSSQPYLVRGMMEQTEDARRHLYDRIYNEASDWLVKGFTSMPETPTGPDDFYWAGSCCHGWSAIAVYYISRYILGVRPLEPGFKKFEVKPYPGRQRRCGGLIPTPNGDIQVMWEKRDEDDPAKMGLYVEVFYPSTTTFVTASYPEFPILEVIPMKYTWDQKSKMPTGVRLEPTRK